VPSLASAASSCSLGVARSIESVTPQQGASIARGLSARLLGDAVTQAWRTALGPRFAMGALSGFARNTQSRPAWSMAPAGTPSGLDTGFAGVAARGVSLAGARSAGIVRPSKRMRAAVLVREMRGER